MADPLQTAQMVADGVQATGLDISQWPPAQVRGLFVDMGILLVAALFVWRLDIKALVAIAGTVASGVLDAQRAKAEAARALADQRHAEAQLQIATAQQRAAEASALDRIKAGRRRGDRSGHAP